MDERKRIKELEISTIDVTMEDRLMSKPAANGIVSVTAETPCIEQPVSEEEQSDVHEAPLIYKIGDRPPLHLILFFAFQQAVLSIAHQLVISTLVAEVVCATHDSEFRARLLSSTLFMTGLTTLLMVTVGSRLPLFQGAAVEYLAPLLALGTVDSTFCVATDGAAAANVTDNSTLFDRDRTLTAVTSLQGSLMVAGAVHTFVGATGIVGILLRFIGPITIVPTVLLIGLYMIKATAKFVVVHWGVAMLTACTTIILSLYLGRKKTPIPVWTRKKGCRIIWYPFHQVFAILIGIIAGCILCVILTVTDAVPNDPKLRSFMTRTDARSDVLQKASWFNFPYPERNKSIMGSCNAGDPIAEDSIHTDITTCNIEEAQQKYRLRTYGAIQFSFSALVGCLLATILSILDSVGDYFACAKTCSVPPPPRHAVNRGLTVEGLCTFLAGLVGCGHATTTYAGNIGAIGLTKVASRWVFVTVGILYMIFGVIGKFSAVFIAIPEPVLGGALICITGVFIGVILSNLSEISLKSTRNLAIIGISLLFGVMVPRYIEMYPEDIQTNNMTLNNFLKMFFGNANFAGAIVAFFLDNTVPGTKEERGITAWHVPSGIRQSADYLESGKQYNPWMPKELRTSKILKFIPFLPGPEVERKNYNFDISSEKFETEHL